MVGGIAGKLVPLLPQFALSFTSTGEGHLGPAAALPQAFRRCYGLCNAARLRLGKYFLDHQPSQPGRTWVRYLSGAVAQDERELIPRPDEGDAISLESAHRRLGINGDDPIYAALE